ncbi:MAG: DUF120 domain-containing protein [Candidatus Micrarchaeota archaeon]
MDELIFTLLKHGAHLRPVRITTTDLGKILGMSQQNASHRLRSLQMEGLVEKTNNGIILTKKAKDEIATIYADLKVMFEGKKLEIQGRITKGLGEGKYYLSLEEYRKQIKEKFGFYPFPGTLNIEIEEKDMWKKQQVIRAEPIIISGFRDKKRAYGDLFSYRCKIGNVDCILVVPIRTHHGPKIMEIVSKLDLKKILRKKDNDDIKVIF